MSYTIISYPNYLTISYTTRGRLHENEIREYKTTWCEEYNMGGFELDFSSLQLNGLPLSYALFKACYSDYVCGLEFLHNSNG